ncbi:MAG: hypothetical protein RLZZ324_476, partial [Candidatus Parcubacteria bacterium]
MRKPRIAIIYGGQSGEHEVSLLSARSVMAALDRSKYDLLPVKIGKDGRWAVSGELLPAAERRALGIGGRRTLAPGAAKGALSTEDGRPAETIDLAIPVIHGTGGEDGCLQGLLELAGIPYAGSGVLGSAVGMDKIAQKMIFEREGFKVSPYAHFSAAQWALDRDGVLARVTRDLPDFPLFIKPANSGSSVGISKAHDHAELEA